MGGQRTTQTEICIEALHKRFDDKHVLRGVDLQIGRGELVAIVGTSGGGKTVLMQHITGHYQAEVGRVCVANHEQSDAPLVDLADLDEQQMDQLRRHWAIVFQPNALLSGSVEYNMSLWMEEVQQLEEPEIHQRVVQAIRDVGLNPDDVLGRDRDELSGGMAKRVAVARAIVMDPMLIIYDEPTTGLDPRHAALIHDLIDRMHHQRPADATGRTSVIITHDTELLRRVSPRILLLHEGQIHFDGSFDAFCASDSPIIRPYIQMMPMLHARD